MRKLLAMCMSILVISATFAGCSSSENTDTSSDTESISTREPEGVSTNTSVSTESTDETTSTESTDSVDSNGSAETNTTAADVDSYEVNSEKLKFVTDQEAPLCEQIGQEIELTDGIKNHLGKLESSDTYCMNIYSYTFGGGHTIEVPMVATANGDDTYVKTNFMGMNMEILTLDGQNYFLDSDSKVYYIANSDDSGATDEASENITNITGLQKDAQSACEVTVNGEDMIRVACTTDELGCYAYIKDGNLRYVASVYEEKVGTLIIIDALSQECDEQLLTIPSDYKEITMEEYMSSTYGDVLGGLFSDDKSESEFAFDYDPNVADSIDIE